MKHTRNLNLLALGIAVANVSSMAYANNASPMEEVVTWGTEVRASSIKIDEKAMAIKQADHISDLLREIPGVDVGGAHSLNQRITIRSMDDKDLKISIDGANQNTYMYHHMGNLQIHADILKSVDVEIGTNSVINGGLGGAVRFETKDAEQLLKDGQQFGGRAQASYGDNSGNSIAITGFGKITDNVDFLLYHNDVNKDNYEVGGGKIKDANGVEVPGTNGEVKGLEGDVKDTLFKLGWDITDSQRIKLGYETYEDKGNYSYRPDMGLATDVAIGIALDAPLVWPTEFTRDTLTLNYEGEFGNTFVRASLFDNQSTLERDESAWQNSTAVIRGTPASDSSAIITGDADNQGLNLLIETGLDNHTFTYGLEHVKYDTRYQARYVFGANAGTTVSSSEEATNISLFIQDRIQLTDQLALIPGIRYDESDVDSATVDKSYDDISGAFAVEYQVNDNLLLKASTTQLFKAPEVAEVFVGAGLGDTPNPDIKAETGTNTELSLAYEDAVLGADKFAFGFTVFQTDIDDYIYDYAGRNFKDNVGDMELEGYEVYFSYDIGNLKTLLTFSDAESDLNANADYASLDGARIDRQQGDTISLNIDYHVESLNLDLHWGILSVDDVSADLDLDGASLDNAKDGFTVHNVSARWQSESLNGLSLTVGVDNLFDKYYASQSSRTGTSFHPLFGQLYLLDYEPGRNMKLTVSYDF